MNDATLGLTDAHMETLKHGPLLMFSLVATADSHADRREWAAFVETVRAGKDHSDELVRQVMGALLPELGETPTAPAAAEDALEGLREIRSLLEALTDGGSAFRSALFELGIAIAEASGAQLTRTFIKGQGLSWTNASGTSAVEHAALENAADALGLT